MKLNYTVSLRGDWASFYHDHSGRDGRMWSAREKSFAKAGNWTEPLKGQTVRHIISPAKLPWVDWVTYNALLQIADDKHGVDDLCYNEAGNERSEFGKYREHISATPRVILS